MIEGTNRQHKMHTQSLLKTEFLEGALIKLNHRAISQNSIEVRPLWMLHLKYYFSKTKFHSKLFS